MLKSQSLVHGGNNLRLEYPTYQCFQNGSNAEKMVEWASMMIRRLDE
jgi:hypothetical protein